MGTWAGLSGDKIPLWELDFLYQSQVALGLTLTPGQWVQCFFQGCKAAEEAGCHNLL